MNSYCKNGNQTEVIKNFGHAQQEEFNWVYDYENRQVTYDDPNDTNDTTYKYNAGGQRISKTNILSLASEHYIHDGANVVADYDGANTLKATYVTPFLDDNLMVTKNQQPTPNNYYYLADGLGSIRELIDSSENTKNSYDYYAFGEALNWSETVENRYTYTAREWDKESQTYFYRARNQDPQIGRFLQADPLGYSDGINLYSYVGNRAANFIDSFGLGKANGQIPNVGTVTFQSNIYGNRSALWFTFGGSRHALGMPDTMSPDVIPAYTLQTMLGDDNITYLTRYGFPLNAISDPQFGVSWGLDVDINFIQNKQAADSEYYWVQIHKMKLVKKTEFSSKETQGWQIDIKGGVGSSHSIKDTPGILFPSGTTSVLSRMKPTSSEGGYIQYGASKSASKTMGDAIQLYKDVGITHDYRHSFETYLVCCDPPKPQGYFTWGYDFMLNENGGNVQEINPEWHSGKSVNWNVAPRSK